MMRKPVDVVILVLGVVRALTEVQEDVQQALETLVGLGDLGALGALLAPDLKA